MIKYSSHTSENPDNLSELAQQSYDFFRPYISAYDYALGTPAARNTSERITQALQRRGEPGACTFANEDGSKSYLKTLQSYHFARSMRDGQKLYYTSWGKIILPYTDLDAHEWWQTAQDIVQAQEVISDYWGAILGQKPLWFGSDRGANGYCLVDLAGNKPEDANTILLQFQNVLGRILRLNGCVCDVEVKGTMGVFRDGVYKAGLLGKLPVHRTDWNHASLDRFRSLDTISITDLLAFVNQFRNLPDLTQENQLLRQGLIAQRFPDLVFVTEDLGPVAKLIGKAFRGGVYLPSQVVPILRQGPGRLVEVRGFVASRLNRINPDWGKVMPTTSEYKQGLCRHHLPCNWLAALGLASPDTGTTPATEAAEVVVPGVGIQRGVDAAEATAATPRSPTPPSPQAGTVATVAAADLGELAHEPDSLVRQREALLDLARRLRRVPDLDEALDYIRENSLFTGDWAEGLSRRRRRVRGILSLISKTFDPSMCGTRGSVPLGCLDDWVDRKLPEGITYHRVMNYLDEDFSKSQRVQTIRVSTDFLKVAMAFIKFYLVISPNEDGSLPQEGPHDLWPKLYQAGLVPCSYCPLKWLAVRETLVRMGIVQIVDRDYRPGQAMKWSVATFFPGLNLWKGEKRRSGLPAGDYPWPEQEVIKNNTEHNTLMGYPPANRHPEQRIRPPPCPAIV